MGGELQKPAAEEPAQQDAAAPAPTARRPARAGFPGAPRAEAAALGLLEQADVERLTGRWHDWDDEDVAEWRVTPFGDLATGPRLQVVITGPDPGADEFGVSVAVHTRVAGQNTWGRLPAVPPGPLRLTMTFDRSSGTCTLPLVELYGGRMVVL